MMRKVAYIYDENLHSECNRLSPVQNRASMVHDLISSYGLLTHLHVEKSTIASEEELQMCHSSYYIKYLKESEHVDSSDEEDEEQLEYGLAYDCPLMDRMFDFVTTIAGGSLTGARLLTDEKYNVVINWFGGWHHAQRDSANGFCYVNDIAIAIQAMSKKYKRILYIDFDAHHGDGVQDLFETSQRILTLSFHKHEPGFFPGTGTLEDCGKFKGKYHSLNVPLLEGVRNESFIFVFDSIFPRISSVYQPNAVVVQCGADCITGDPLGQCNITPEAIGHCIKQILNLNLPTIFVGGGGYNFANTARHWTYLTSVILDQYLPGDIPDESEYFTDYGPDFELEIQAGFQKDTNSKEYLKLVIGTLLSYCNSISIS